MVTIFVLMCFLLVKQCPADKVAKELGSAKNINRRRLIFPVEVVRRLARNGSSKELRFSMVDLVVRGSRESKGCEKIIR